MPESEMILTNLALIDMVLVGSLVVMVMFSGYENFVSRIDVENEDNKLELVGQTRRRNPKAQGSRVYRGHIVDPFAACLHERPQIPNDKLMW